MQTSRREMIRGLVAGAATAAAAAGAVAAVNAIAQSTAPAAREGPAGAPASAGATKPALTTDGKVVHIHDHGARADVCSPGLPPAADPTGRRGVPGRKWIMVIDLAKCDGCAKCSEACSAMHHIPPDRQWIAVLAMRDAQLSAPYWFPRPCFHCDNPPCTKVCPVDATYKTQDGTVLVDNLRCIGCRFCMAACPYGVRCFNWSRPKDQAGEERGYNPEWGYPRKIGTVEKCDFCPDMAAAGKLPGCVSGCPMDAIYFGDQNEDAVTCRSGQTLRLSKLLHDRAGYRHLEDLGTEPRVYYLPPVNRQYPAPKAAQNEPLSPGSFDPAVHSHPESHKE